jgi:DNA-binding transcriptional LysR family regulator
MSFTQAAEQLHLTQSAVSHKIKNLERTLSIQLFVRQPRNLHLTSSGTRLHCVLSQQFGDISHQLRALHSFDLSGDFNVSVPPTFAQSWLLPRWGSFVSSYPNLQANLRTRNGWVDFQTELFDCAIYFGDGNYVGLHSEKLFDESLMPVCSPKYAEQMDLIGNVENLKNCLLIHDAAPWAKAGQQDEWRLWSDHHEIQLSDKECSFDRADLALQGAEYGLGVAIGRGSFVKKALEEGRLIAPFDLSVTSPFSYFLVCRPEVKNSGRFMAFQMWLSTQLTNDNVD